jgi:hypothetical protein
MPVYTFPKQGGDTDVFGVFDHLREFGVEVVELVSDADEYMLTTDVELDAEQVAHLGMTLQE